MLYKTRQYFCFREAASKDYFQKVLLINFASTYANWLKAIESILYEKSWSLLFS